MAVGAAAVAAAGATLMYANRPTSPDIARPPATTAGAASAAPSESGAAPAFKPTDAQLAAFNIQPARIDNFHSQIRVEGTFAVDESHSTPVYSPFTGRITRLMAQPGDAVKAGDPLFAVFAGEEVQTETDLRSALAARATAAAQLNLARISEKRQHDMFDAKVGSREDWLQAQSYLSAAQGAMNTAEATLASARNRLRIMGRSEADVRSLEKGARSGGEVTVVAPIAGTVTQRSAGAGQHITSLASGGATALYTIADLSNVWLMANVRESEAESVHVDDKATVEVAAIPGRQFDATVQWVSPTIDPATHRLPVRVVMSNAEGLLKPAMLANVTISTSAQRQAMSIALRAVVYDGPDAHVWVLQPDGTLVSRQVQGPTTLGDRIEVLHGLQAGDRVVESGALFIDRAAGAQG